MCVGQAYRRRDLPDQSGEIIINRLSTLSHMKIEQGTSFGSVGEHDVDFSVAQLVETSDSFRHWFVSQTDSALDIVGYIGGVLHASYAGEGESDIEFGFLTSTGDRHIVLVENKISAEKQPNQIERYYNRGEFRVERDGWDSYTVCLLAPESYVSTEDEAEFDSIIYYEDVLEQIKSGSYDGGDFLGPVFEAALTKSRTSNTADATDTLEKREQLRAAADRYISQRVEELRAELSERRLEETQRELDNLEAYAEAERERIEEFIENYERKAEAGSDMDIAIRGQRQRLNKLEERIGMRRKELQRKAQVISLAPEVENLCLTLPV